MYPAVLSCDILCWHVTSYVDMLRQIWPPVLSCCLLCCHLTSCVGLWPPVLACDILCCHTTSSNVTWPPVICNVTDFLRWNMTFFDVRWPPTISDELLCYKMTSLDGIWPPVSSHDIFRGASLSRSGPVSHWVCLSECLRVTLLLRFFTINSGWQIAKDGDRLLWIVTDSYRKWQIVTKSDKLSEVVIYCYR